MSLSKTNERSDQNTTSSFYDNQRSESMKDNSQPKVKVLLLEHSDAMCEFFKKEIEKDKNTKVIGMVRNAHEARNKIIALEPDILIMDIMNPHSGGVEFLKRLNRFYPMPVLLVSPLTKIPSHLAVSAFEAGVIDIIDRDAFCSFPSYQDSLGFPLYKKIRIIASYFLKKSENLHMINKAS